MTWLGNAPKYLEASRTEAMKKYQIIIEKTNTGYSAYSPDVPGCAATGASKEEVETNIREAIQFHIHGLKEEGYEVPEPRTEPTTDSSYVFVAA
jgi:predicted RNase H-like HicB family nuclease